MKDPAIQEIQDLLGYQFQNADLLVQALTHRSLPADQSGRKHPIGHNERMEFLGDAILGLVVSQFLYETHPAALEGDLTAMKGYLVSRKTLASVAERLQLGSFLRLGSGEESSKGRKKQSILAGAMEAVVAAIYLDGGWGHACKVLLPHFQKEVERILPLPLVDPKSQLQVLVQLHFRTLPKYRVAAQEGPAHNPHFLVEVRVGRKLLGKGKGKSKKEAEQEAAQCALSRIR
jgi:ribonuclease III